MPVSQSAATDLNKQLTGIQNRGCLVASDGFEYQSLEREIRKLIKTQAELAYAMLGTLCGLAGDADGLRSNFAKALRLSVSPDIRANYPTALINLGFYSNAVKDMAFLERPENGMLKRGIQLNLECCRFRTAARLMKLWNELHPKETFDLTEIERIATMVEGADIGDDAFLPCLDVIGEVMRNHRLIFLSEPLINVVGYDGPDAISYRLLVNLSPKSAASLQADMVDALFDSGVNFYESIIRFAFVAAGESTQKAA